MAEKGTAVLREEALRLLQRKGTIRERIQLARIIQRWVIERAHRQGMRHFFENG
jgi:hypothetical protein